jgi:uncharacterized protein YpmB
MKKVFIIIFCVVLICVSCSSRYYIFTADGEFTTDTEKGTKSYVIRVNLDKSGQRQSSFVYESDSLKRDSVLNN